MRNYKIGYTPILIYIIAFYASFRNANIYIFGGINDTYRILIDYLFLIFSIAVLFILLLNKKMNCKNTLDFRIMMPMVLLLWVLIQSSLNSIYTGENMIPRILITSLITYINLVIGIQTQEMFNKALWSLLLGGSLSAIIPLIKFSSLIGTRISFHQGIVYSGGIWNQVLISFISCAWLALALIQKKTQSRKMKALGVFVFVITWIGSFAGLSRSFFILTIVSFLVYIISSDKIKDKLRFITIVVIILIMLENFMGDTVLSLTNRLTNTMGNISEEARIEIWKSYLSNFPKYYLVGTMGDHVKYAPPGIFGPHSAFLNWLVQYGLIGITGFLTMLGITFKEIISVKKYAPNEYSFLLSGFIGYLIQISISQTGFLDVSVFAGLAFFSIWGKFMRIEDL